MIELLRAESENEFRRKLALVDIHVQPRGAGRTKEQTERFNIVHLLATLPSDRLQFPVIVRHGDRPDCVLQAKESLIGIELTEAVPENVAHATVLRRRGVGPKIHFLQRATPGEPKRSTGELLREIELDRPGPPWRGNAPEREWAVAILHFITGKLETVRKPGFTRYDKNWLLIYDNWPLPNVEYAEAGEILAEQCMESGVLGTFDRIFVLTPNVLCEISDQVKLHEVREPRVDS